LYDAQVLLKYLCHVNKAKSHETEVSDVETPRLSLGVKEVSAGFYLLLSGSDVWKPNVILAVDCI